MKSENIIMLLSHSLFSEETLPSLPPLPVAVCPFGSVGSLTCVSESAPGSASLTEEFLNSSEAKQRISQTIVL